MKSDDSTSARAPDNCHDWHIDPLDDGWFVARCSCGWSGDPTWAKLASHDGRRHAFAAAPATPPRDETPPSDDAVRDRCPHCGGPAPKLQNGTQPCRNQHCIGFPYITSFNAAAWAARRAPLVDTGGATAFADTPVDEVDLGPTREIRTVAPADKESLTAGGELPGVGAATKTNPPDLLERLRLFAVRLDDDDESSEYDKDLVLLAIDALAALRLRADAAERTLANVAR